MNLRQANIDDLKDLQNLFVDTIKHTCKNDYSKEQIDVWTSSIQNEERWKNKLKTQYFIVAQIEEEIVGFGSLENGNYVDMMYVHKDHLRKGVAHRILIALKQEAHKFGTKILSSDVSTTALPFFEKNEFSIIKKNEFELNGVLISNYHMRSN